MVVRVILFFLIGQVLVWLTDICLWSIFSVSEGIEVAGQCILSGAHQVTHIARLLEGKFLIISR